MIVRLFCPHQTRSLGNRAPHYDYLQRAPLSSSSRISFRGRRLLLFPGAGYALPDSRRRFFMIHSYLLLSGASRQFLGDDVPFYGPARAGYRTLKNLSVEQRGRHLPGRDPLGAARTGPLLSRWAGARAGTLGLSKTARARSLPSGEEVGYLVSLRLLATPATPRKLARRQAGSKENVLCAPRLGPQVIAFHRKPFGDRFSTNQKVNYVAAAVGAKVTSVSQTGFISNIGRKRSGFCQKILGCPYLHFMHNVQPHHPSIPSANTEAWSRTPAPLLLFVPKKHHIFPGAEEHCGWSSIVKGGVVVLWGAGRS